MKRPNKPATTASAARFDPVRFLEEQVTHLPVAAYDKGATIFSQGDDANHVYYLKKGKIKISVVSMQGKEAVIALLSNDDILGEGCLNGQPKRLASAICVTECHLIKIEKNDIRKMIQGNPEFSQFFINYLLTKNEKTEDDLLDQLFNSTERRLARILLLLANFGKEGKPEPVISKISQEMLAEMIGTTRSRVSHFMNKFRRLGFIQYNGHLEVHSSLLTVVLAEPTRSVGKSR